MRRSAFPCRRTACGLGQGAGKPLTGRGVASREAACCPPRRPGLGLFALEILGAMPMATFDRITSIPTILNGQPTIRGMRLSVRRVVEALAVTPNWDDLRREYPELEPEDIRQALEFAARNLDESVQPLEAA